ncbi:MAG: hypothetical protein ACYSUX_00425 [Planctomycetota bacterium]|jgi:hypothetical protein
MKKILSILFVLCITSAIYAADADTANKRGAVGQLIFAPTLPFPDGTIDANDREQMAGLYPIGSLSGSPATGIGGATVGIASRNLDKLTMEKRMQGNYVYASAVLLIAIIGYEITGKYERKSKC